MESKGRHFYGRKRTTNKKKKGRRKRRKEGGKEERKKSFDSLGKSVGELGKSEKIII